MTLALGVQGNGNSTIRYQYDEEMKRLRTRAAEHNLSVQDEARRILSESIAYSDPEIGNLAKFTRECFAPLGGVQLDIPMRGPMRSPPKFLLAI